MKKTSLIVFSVLTVVTLSFWFACYPFRQNMGGSANFSVLDDSAGSRLVVTSRIDVIGTTWDGAGMTITPDGFEQSFNDGLGPFMTVTNGTVKNFTASPYITYASGTYSHTMDGIWVYGNCSIENVTYIDNFQDVITVKKPGTINVSNINASISAGSLSGDRLFQINDLCTITFKNTTGGNLNKMVRQNGSKTWKMICYIDGANLTDMREAVFRSDSSVSTVYWRNITCNLPQSQWWYETGKGVYNFKVIAY
jgi:pectate lyase C